MKLNLCLAGTKIYSDDIHACVCVCVYVVCRYVCYVVIVSQHTVTYFSVLSSQAGFAHVCIVSLRDSASLRQLERHPYTRRHWECLYYIWVAALLRCVVTAHRNVRRWTSCRLKHSSSRVTCRRCWMRKHRRWRVCSWNLPPRRARWNISHRRWLWMEETRRPFTAAMNWNWMTRCMVCFLLNVYHNFMTCVCFLSWENMSQLLLLASPCMEHFVWRGHQHHYWQFSATSKT